MEEAGRHPLAFLDADALLQELDALVEAGDVVERALSDARSIFKHAGGGSRVNGTARLARGLIMERAPARVVNFPIPKFDGVVAEISEHVHEYHRAVCEALPERVLLQPMHDGTCVHAVYVDGAPLVSTFLATNSPQALRAKELLAKASWDDAGITYAFELIDAADPKVQERRAVEGLHLFYACTRDGRHLSRDELAAAASRLGVSLVKQQPASRSTVVAQLTRMDESSRAEDVRKGMIALLGDGRRVKIESHAYHVLARHEKPTSRWLDAIIRQSDSMERVHEAVEAYEGCLDLNARARGLLVALLAKARAFIEETGGDEYRVDDDELLRLLRRLAASPQP